MEEALNQFVAQLHGGWLGLLIVVCLAVLGKAADRLVDEAVVLSERSGIPKIVVGATIVSLGTTSPEVAVSVTAALQGSPALALGNAVGSIICDTGLILGLACLIAPLRLDRKIVNRQGWVQLGSAVAIILASFPWSSPGVAFSTGGRLPQWAGFVFLAALAVYIVQSIRWARFDRSMVLLVEEHEEDLQASTLAVAMKLVVALGVVVASAWVLIPAVEEAALRMRIPESIIAATMVAFGTSLPELVTAVTAARRGHGELAVGNIVGADILNVLFVAGASAAVTPGGLLAGGHFFLVLYPIMVFILLVFRIGIAFSGDYMKRPFGLVLLAAYGVYLVVGFLGRNLGGH
jgi:cation:H+ antiporter